MAGPLRRTGQGCKSILMALGSVIASAKQPNLKGVWTKETNCILIQRDEVENGYKTWEAFTLPLKKEGTQGGNWRGARVLATKMQ